MHRTKTPQEIDAYQHHQRSVRWRTEPDGMVLFTLRLPPFLAARLIAILTTLLMRTRVRGRCVEHPTVAQQHADNIATLFDEGNGSLDVEVVVHVRADGCTLDDGTPIAASTVDKIADSAFIRALIHDAECRPMDATNRRRHPTDRQKPCHDERQPPPAWANQRCV